MALDFQNYLYSSSPPDFELFTPHYIGRRRRSPPKIDIAKLKEDDRCINGSFQQLQLDDFHASDDLWHEDYGVDIVGLTKCKDRSVLFVLSFRDLLVNCELGAEVPSVAVHLWRNNVEKSADTVYCDTDMWDE